jgi:hypothetical protein
MKNRYQYSCGLNFRAPVEKRFDLKLLVLQRSQIDYSQPFTVLRSTGFYAKWPGSAFIFRQANHGPANGPGFIEGRKIRRTAHALSDFTFFPSIPDSTPGNEHAVYGKKTIHDA